MDASQAEVGGRAADEDVSDTACYLPRETIRP